jgi:hypothetical protein
MTNRATRILGALVGVGFGTVFVGIGLAVASSDDARAAVKGVGTTLLALGGLLGFAFAPRAAQPGERSALSTSALLTAVAVPLGAIFIAALEFGAETSSSWLESAGGIGAIALVGLLFLGLPLAGLVFVVANLWVISLRAVLRLAIARSGIDNRSGDISAR